MKKIIGIALTVVLFTGFFYGILVGHYEIFPFEIISNLFQNLTGNQNDVTEPRLQISQDLAQVNNLIQINNHDDILMKKNLMIDYLWLDDGFPSSKIPSEKNIDLKDDQFLGMENLDRIDSFTVEMEFGMTSISYLFLPKESNNKLVIYHQGHDKSSLRGADSHSFEQDKEIIQNFLNKNFSVLIFSMVGKGMNNEPDIDLPNFGTIHLNSHEHFRLIESEKLHPLKFFIEPVIITLNQVEDDYSFDSFYMVGLNGGGWSTIIISSLDDRIEKSYSVAGSFPIWLRSNLSNFGDYEQTLPEFYSIANYEELYLISAYGKNRELILFYNEFDPCCFSGTLYEKFPFGNIIKNKLNNLGIGEFEVIIDKGQDKHIISDNVLTIIISSMEN